MKNAIVFDTVEYENEKIYILVNKNGEFNACVGKKSTGYKYSSFEQALEAGKTFCKGYQPFEDTLDPEEFDGESFNFSV